MIATLFGEDGRFRAFMNGQDETCAATAQEMNCRLVAGDYQGHYWPDDEEEPLPLGTLPYAGAVTVAPGGDLVITEGRAGDVMWVNGVMHTLEDDEPVELAFPTAGVFPVTLDFVGFHLCDFTVTVDED
jgi:hypothetical protein